MEKAKFNVALRKALSYDSLRMQLKRHFDMNEINFASISDVLTYWRTTKPDKSLAWFAKRVGVAPSTIKRILEKATQRPDFATGRSVCFNALPMETAKAVLQRIYPEHGEYISQDILAFREIQKFENSELLGAFNNLFEWQILNLTSIRDVPKKYFESLGQEYVYKSQKLLERGLLTYVNEVYKCKFDLGHVVSGKYLMQAVKFVMQSLQQKSERGNPDENGQLFFAVFGLNAEGKAAAKQIMLEYIARIIELSNVTEYSGENAVALSATLSDLL